MIEFDDKPVLPANERAYQIYKKVRDLAREDAFKSGMPESEIMKIVITEEMAAKYGPLAAKWFDSWMKRHA